MTPEEKTRPTGLPPTGTIPPMDIPHPSGTKEEEAAPPQDTAPHWYSPSHLSCILQHSASSRHCTHLYGPTIGSGTINT